MTLFTCAHHKTLIAVSVPYTAVCMNLARTVLGSNIKHHLNVSVVLADMPEQWHSCMSYQQTVT